MNILLAVMLVAATAITPEDRQLLALALRSRDVLVIRSVQSYLKLKYGTIPGVPTRSDPFGDMQKSLICQDYNGNIYCY